MLGLFVTEPWPSFYRKGMKTWEIRTYPTDYRGDIVLIESHSNIIICKMQLNDCIPLSKERWEMNYEKHRTTCSYEDLPYRKNGSPAYAWILSDPIIFDEEIVISRSNSKPYIQLDNSLLAGKTTRSFDFSSERIACKFLGDTMLLYWMKKSYFALIAVVNLSTGNTQLITAEIAPEDVNYILNQLQADP